MEISNEIGRYDLSMHEVIYEPSHHLLIRNNDGDEVKRIALIGNQIGLKISGAENQASLLVGEGNSTTPFFTRVFQPRPEYTPFAIENARMGIGEGHLRDFRVKYAYDLREASIVISCDGTYLSIECPGDPNEGELPWYQQVAGN